ncbi:MAG: hypothetical protein IJ639_10565 [Ruminococcus sp.]|nr:hypothetical protein [Ruminococcus sp.]
MTLSYIYVVLWYVLALYLIYMGVKQDKFYFVPAVFFVFLGTWALVNNLIETNLMVGVYGWIYRGVAILALIVCALKYYFSKKGG